ncbi:hypothetical protein BGZ79_010325 [Entomortierella chlamydospora]|nr:hypothetical protein BGZ79_010325 [Entomortierella chlamydospora]
MAPKQKASETSGKSHANNNSNDRQGNSERGHGHANGNSASERGGGGSGAGNERSTSGAGHGHGHAHGEKTSSSNAGSGAGAKRKAETPIITVDIADMDINALRRYCRLNKLKPKSKSKDDLVAAATKHWNSVNAKEIDSVAYFLFAVKHRRKWKEI